MACAAVAAALSGLAQAESTWRHVPQLPLQGDTQSIFADLDGDGTAEIVFVTVSAFVKFGRHHALGALRVVSDELALRELVSVGSMHGDPVATPPMPNAQKVLVAITAEDGSGTQVLEFGGRPLRLMRTFDPGVDIRPVYVGDIDDDGTLEIVGPTLYSAEPAVAAFDYVSGTEEWRVLRQTTEVTVAQLDLDPMMEVVVGGSPGLVLDGASGAEEWLYPSGFTGDLLVGRFETDSTTPTFASVLSRLRIFRSLPYSPIREFEMPGFYQRGSSAFDVDADGVDEVVSAPGVSYAISIIEPSDGSATEVPIPWSSSTVPAIGRSTADGPILISHGDTAERGMQVLEYPALVEAYRAPVEKGPFSSVGFGRIDGKDDRIVLLSGREPAMFPGWHRLAATVWDAEGHRLAERTGIADVNWDKDGVARLHMTNLDGVPGDEIVAAISLHNATSLVVMDGQTLEDRWRIESMNGNVLENRKPEVIDSIDFDSDAIDDIVMAVRVNYHQARILVLSGLDGSLLWESISLKDWGLNTLPDLAIADVDADGVSEVMISFGLGVYAFDSETLLLDWTYSPSDEHTVDALTTWGSGDGCRIGTALSDERFAIHRCSDQSFFSTIDLPGRASAVLPLDATGSAFAVTARGRVWRLEASGHTHPISPALGVDVDMTMSNALLPDADGGFQIVVGSSVSVERLRIAPDPIFGHGFEADE